MAGQAFNAQMNLTLNSQSLNTATKEIRQALGRITGNASEFQKSLDASTARVFAFGATTLVIQGVNQAFKALIGTTIEVEKRMTEIKTIFSGTAQEFNAFRESVFQVAKDTGQAFSVVADAAAEFARQGLNAEETAKRLEAALVLTNVSGLDSVKSVNTLTAAINGFKSAALTAEQVTNKLVAVDTRFAVSAKDLADGLTRAGSTAEDARVSFDELLGIITAVQQKTQRGGAVIGNALKTIFTRLGRQGAIEDLQALGVAIDESQSGIQKLKALGEAFEAASGDPSKQNKIKEISAGGFQINIISAALKDLNSEQSIFADATKASTNAAQEGYEKNAKIVKTLSGQINALIVSLTNMAEKVGQITFAPILGTLVDIASKVSGFLNEALDPEKGNAFVKGILKSIGSFVSGPGLVLLTTAFIKVISLVAKFAKDGFKSVLSINSESEKLKSIQVGIVNSLNTDKKFREAILSTTLTHAEKQQAIADAINRENKLLREQERILTAIGKFALSRGISGFDTGSGFVDPKGKPKNAAKGFVPSFQASAQETMMETSAAREHGYKAGKVFNTRLYDGTGGSFKATVNSAEKIKTVKGPNGELGTYVIPPNGLAAKGFVPNYAPIKAPYAGAKKIREAEQNGTLESYKKGGTYFFPDGSQAAESQVLTVTRRSENISARDEARTQLRGGSFGMLVPNLGFVRDNPQFIGSIDKTPYVIDNLAIRGPDLSKTDRAADPNDELLKKNIVSKIIDESAKFANSLGGSRLDRKAITTQFSKNSGARGAINGAVGAAFDASVLAAYPSGRYSDSKNKELNKIGGDFDLRNVDNDVKTLFNLPRTVTTADFKASPSSDNIKSFVGKIMKEQRVTATQKGEITRIDNRNKKLQGKASGFVPNFSQKPQKLQEGDDFEKRVFGYLGMKPPAGRRLDFEPTELRRQPPVRKSRIGLQGDYGDVKLSGADTNEHNFLGKLIAHFGLADKIQNLWDSGRRKAPIDLNALEPKINSASLFYEADPSIYQRDTLKASISDVLHSSRPRKGENSKLLEKFNFARAKKGISTSSAVKPQYRGKELQATIFRDGILDPSNLEIDEPFGKGFVPNFGLKNIIESAKFAGNAAKTFGKALPKGTISSAVKGQLDPETIWPQLEAFIMRPEKLITNIASLEKAKTTIRTFLSNDILRDRFAKRVAPLINTDFYNNADALKSRDYSSLEENPEDENYLKYKLLGGTKSIKDSGFSVSGISEKGAFSKLKQGSYYAKDVADAARRAINHDQMGNPNVNGDQYDPRMLDKKGKFYGYSSLLGGFTGRVKQYKGKKFASYNDRWDVDLNAQEKKMLYRHLSGEEISQEEFYNFTGSTNSYEAQSFAPYILRELVSAIPKAQPARFKGVVSLANGFVPNFVRSSRKMGSGEYGSFYKLNDKIGTKRFNKETPRDKIPVETSDIVEEYANASLLANVPVVRGITGPKVVNSLEDAIRARRIRKEIVTWPMAKDAIGLTESSNVGDILEWNLTDNGLMASDLHGNNYAMNQQAVRFFNENDGLPMLGKGSRSGWMGEFARSGSMASIVDAGLMHATSQNLKNYISNIASQASQILGISSTTKKQQSSKIRSTTAKTAANGFIPNFNIFKAFPQKNERMSFVGAAKRGNSKVLDTMQKAGINLKPSRFGQAPDIGKLKKLFQLKDSQQPFNSFFNKAYEVADTKTKTGASEDQMLAEFWNLYGKNPIVQKELSNIKAEGFVPNFADAKKQKTPIKGRNTFQKEWLTEQSKKTGVSLNNPDAVFKLGAKFAKKYPNDQYMMALAEGFVPNFVSKSRMMGFGAQGSFAKLNENVGVKKFDKSLSPQKLQTALEREWLSAQHLWESTQGEMVTGPKVLSSLADSIRRKGIRKEIINDPLARAAVGGEKAREFGIGFLKNLVLQKTGLEIPDLHGSNYTVNDAAKEYLLGDASKKAGAKFNIIDTGLAKAVGYKAQEAYRRLYAQKEQAKKKAASGFIPNFSAVNDAIKREQSAGVPKSAIYLDSSPQLKSSRNPSGLMVANSIDEPKGGYQGIQRAKKEGKNPKMYGAAGGFVPNYAAKIGGISVKSGTASFDLNASAKLNDALQNMAKEMRAGKMTLSTARKNFESLTKTLGVSNQSQKDLNSKGQGLIGAYDLEMKNRKALADSIRQGRAQRGKKTSGPNGFDKTLEMAKGGLDKFNNKLIGAQFGLFAISTAAEGLVGDNKELSEGIQKTTQLLGSALAISQVAPAFLSLLTPIGLVVGAFALAGAAILYFNSQIKKFENEGEVTKGKIRSVRGSQNQRKITELTAAGVDPVEIEAIQKRQTAVEEARNKAEAERSKLEKLQNNRDLAGSGILGNSIITKDLDQKIKNQSPISEAADAAYQALADQFDKDNEAAKKAAEDLKKSFDFAKRLSSDKGFVGERASAALTEFATQDKRFKDAKKAKAEIDGQLKNENIKGEARNALQNKQQQAEEEFNSADTSLKFALNELQAIFKRGGKDLSSELKIAADMFKARMSKLNEEIEKSGEALRKRSEILNITQSINAPEDEKFSKVLPKLLEIQGAKTNAQFAQNEFNKGFSDISKIFDPSILKIDDTPQKNKAQAERDLIAQNRSVSNPEGTLTKDQQGKIDENFKKELDAAQQKALESAKTKLPKIEESIKSGDAQSRLFETFVSGGEKAFDQVFKGSFSFVDLGTEGGKALYDSLLEGAKNFKGAIIEGYTKAKNIQNEINNQIKQTGLELIKAQKEALSSLPSTLEKIKEGPSVDPLALFKKFEEAAKLLKTGKAEDAKKATDILSSTSKDSEAFKGLFGQKSLEGIQERAGLDPSAVAKTVESATFSKTIFDSIENTIKDSLTGGNRLQATKALENVKADPSKINEFIETINRTFTGSLAGKGKQITSSVQMFAPQGPSSQDITRRLAGTSEIKFADKETVEGLKKAIAEFSKNAQDPKAFEGLKKQLESVFGQEKGSKAAEAYKTAANRTREFSPEDDAVKGLTERQKQLQVEMKMVEEQIKGFAAAFDKTSITKSIDALDQAVKDASTGVTSFATMTKTLDNISVNILGRLSKIEEKIGAAGKNP